MSSKRKSKLILPVSERDNMTGISDSPVTLVEYGDYECPICARAYPVIKKIIDDFADDLLFVYRHFPMKTIHPRAYDAATAAETAGAQGYYWEMHDLLFENQGHFEPEDLEGYARSLNLDIDRFKREISENTYSEKIREDFRSGVRSGVNRTPTFFINGLRYDGLFYHWDLSDAIKKELNQK
jgi:protein-disulfide isomerase